MSKVVKVDRRDFLKVTSAGPAGLVLASCASSPNGERAAAFEPNVFVAVETDGRVIFHTPRPEMGQGSRTGLKMIVADELEAEWDAIEIVMALAGPREVWGSMTAGGSTSIRLFWEPLGNAAAAAREMLVAAAAQQWGVPVEECRAESGKVFHDASDRSLTYGELAVDAEQQDVPEEPTRKTTDQFRYIGKEQARVDIPEKVDGSAVYGLDFRTPGMKFAVVRLPPTIGGSLRSWDDTDAREVNGFQEVVQISAGVAVVADHTWAALKAMDRLKIDWDPGPHANLSSVDIARQLETDGQAEPVIADEQGDPKAALSSAAKTISAVYEAAFISHSPLEPINATAHVQGNEADVWVPTQAPQTSQAVSAEALGVPTENIRLHTTYVGAGFGRRLISPWTADAVEVSKAIGAPVQIMWTRDEDTTHGNYRPIARYQADAAFDASGRWTALRHRVIAHSTSGESNPDRFRTEVDRGAMAGILDVAYNWPAALIEWKMSNTPLTTGALRSVYAGQNCFVTESFLDEIANETGRDPLELRLELLEGQDDRLQALLRKVAEEIDWGRRMPARRGLGLACTHCFGGRLAHAVEVEVEDDGTIRVHRVETAIDSGWIVYPDGTRQQTEGGVNLALSIALNEQITVLNGQVEQKTFSDYPILRFSQAPDVNLHIIDGGPPLGGVGEPIIPPLAPAVGNAIFAATGVRMRKLPMGKVPV